VNNAAVSITQIEEQEMEKRNVILLTGVPGEPPSFGEDFAETWKFTVSSSVSDARRAMQVIGTRVGLVEFSDSAPDTLLRWHERLLMMNPEIAWLALVPPRLLEIQAFRDHLFRKFIDFHTWPYDPQRLSHSLGHAYGMSRLKWERPRSHGDGEFAMIGHSEAMQRVYAGIAKAASVDYPALITGEIGSGKGTVARAIHDHSHRSRHPFVVVDCSMLTADALLSELDSCEVDLTDDVEAPLGRIARARAGTVLLDEIGDLSPAAQAVLAGALQRGVLLDSGGNNSAVRVIASTQGNLEMAVREGRFREDLYYRINVLSLSVPPLKERREDILPLAEHFLEVLNSGSPSSRIFSKEAREVLSNFAWPGNIRALINRISSALVMGEGTAITPADLGLERREPGRAVSLDLDEARMMAERNVLLAALRHSKNNLTAAAKSLKISRMTMYRMMEKLGLSVDRLENDQGVDKIPDGNGQVIKINGWAKPK
jgi:DNA-binding NtrC family response regulator